MSCSNSSTCIKIGFDVSADHSEHHDQAQSCSRDGGVRRRVSLLSKALANPQTAVSQFYGYSDIYSDSDEDGECSDGDSTDSLQSSSSVSSPIPIQCSHSRLAAGFAIARWQLRQQQRHYEEELAQNGVAKQAYATRNAGPRS